MTAPNKSHKSILQIYSSVLAKISSAIALILTYIWAKTENTEEKYLGGLNWNDQVFNWHPVLMVAGLVFAFTCGITSFHHPCLSKSVNKTLHVLSYILAIICFSVGLKAVWKSHDKKDDYKANLYSFHAWIGLVAVVLFAQNFVLGCFHFLNAYVPIRYRQMYMPFHIFLGIIAFIASIIATETGISEKTAFEGGCGYTVNNKDTNPSEHYNDIPNGCKVSQGIGMMVFITTFFTIFSILDLKFVKISQEEILEPLNQP